MSIGSVDGTSSNKILDGGTVGVAEGTTEFSIGGVVESQGIAAAVESALERIESIPTGICAPGRLTLMFCVI